MKTAIIIPARYGSTRFPGKPLVKIGGKSMLERVVEIGRNAIKDRPSIALAVATEDKRIADHCEGLGVDCYVTSPDCPTGSDRILEASNMMAAHNPGQGYDFIIGLQGDAPFTPPQAIHKMLEAVDDNPSIDVVTPVINLRWNELSDLRDAKNITPFSGTTAIIDQNGTALWFSKNIIPAIRKEDMQRKVSEFSPVYQHIGLYGYRADILKNFVALPQSRYEQLEGLEQLRLLENGITIQTVTLDVEAGLAQAGIDSPEDVERVERVISQHGEPF